MLSLGVQLLTPRHHIGAVGVIFNDAGQVLMVEHVFRPYHAWGLPGGWVNRGENPAQTIQREVKEELNLTIDIEQARSGYEVLSTRWVDPEQIEWRLLPLQQRAIILGKQEFDRE
jgi:8-oxo-dGTP pyrophosphatase MutT (NUDIX family)